MESRLFVCVFVCVFIVFVHGQVGSLCRPNERLLSCGCPKTCRDPVPDCEGVCKEGCFCQEGEVRNDTGHCVKLADCPPVTLAYKQETTEPRINGGECPPNEEYRFCEPCNRTCDNPNPMCPFQCVRGCFCKGDLLRDKDGRCVQFHQCSNFLDYIREKEKNFIEPVPYRFTCGRNQVYKECVKCTQSCGDPQPNCTSKCKTGCFCKDGLVKAPDGSCVKPEDCPQVVVNLPLPYPFNIAELSYNAHSTSLEDCPSSEEYFSCGWCEPSCRDPNPKCPATCTRGCLCRPPLLRHASGTCVMKHECKPNKCSGINEIYVCRYGCEPRCNSAPCLSRPRRCVRGCTCRIGFFRDNSGKCVTEDECEKNNPFVIVLDGPF